jgi:hypothetical protein
MPSLLHHRLTDLLVRGSYRDPDRFPWRFRYFVSLIHLLLHCRVPTSRYCLCRCLWCSGKDQTMWEKEEHAVVDQYQAGHIPARDKYPFCFGETFWNHSVIHDQQQIRNLQLLLLTCGDRLAFLSYADGDFELDCSNLDLTPSQRRLSQLARS